MGTLMISTAPVLHFRDVGLGDVQMVGGKGASLGELLRAGIQVPTGFSVKTAAFRQVVDHLIVADDSGAYIPVPSRVASLYHADGYTLARVTATVRQFFESAPLPPEVA